jgi:O-antigen chain-terminating methyltransferase
MLDVDGQVISADVLVERIGHLLEAVHSGSQTPGAASADAAAPVALDAPIHSMRVIHSQMHPPEVGGTGSLRGRAGSVVKRAVRRATSWYVEPRWILQQQLDSQGIEFSAQAYNAVYRIDNELDELRRQVTRLKMQLVAAIERTNLVRREVAGLAEEQAAQSQKIEHSAMQTDIRPLTREITSILDRLGAVGTTGADIDYVGFEDRFRGNTDELRASQERYLKLFPSSSASGKIIDIGCGRGEMLSILQQAGHEVMGVDSDPDMIEACISRGLPAVVDDGIQYLSRVEDDSLKGIFCAQVVEHLITPELERLILLAREKLQPGGVMVIETINPRSSYALGNHFYADTSHVRPVHPETLRYICEQVGFRSVELEERSPHPLLGLTDELPAGPVGEAVAALLENVFGHQDYVIVASK